MKNKSKKPAQNMVRIEYSTNNSGGKWWLKDKDWLTLEENGWEIEWGGKWFCNSSYGRNPKPAYLKELCPKGPNCPGHRRFTSRSQMTKKDEFLGSYAQHASKDFPTLADGIREWETLLGKDASDEGCNCCGEPHNFSGGGQYVSGKDVVDLLYGVRGSYRDLAERLKK